MTRTSRRGSRPVARAVAPCSALQHTATKYNTLQRAATHLHSTARAAAPTHLSL